MPNIILDFLHEDPGLKLLFTDAEYYSFVQNPQYISTYPNIIPSQEIEKIEFAAAASQQTPKSTFMIIAPLYKCFYTWNGQINPQFCSVLYEYFSIFVHIATNCEFENILFFDTHSYQYDPNSIFEYYRLRVLSDKMTFFKRNYANNVVYKNNVFPFPYIGSSTTDVNDNVNDATSSPCIIDLLQQFIKKYKKGQYKLPDRNRLFYSGKLMIKRDNIYGLYTDCIEKLQKIKNTVGEYLIYREKMPDESAYKIELSRSNFCLSLTEECGAPTRKIFEILSCGSLHMCEIDASARFMWNFGEDDFLLESYFVNETDLFAKLNFLGGNVEKYYMCLHKQHTIVNTYMSKSALRRYIKKCCHFATSSTPQNFDSATSSTPQNFDFTASSTPQNFEHA